MSWDAVEVGLAGGEETVNFGPRNETGSTLYQVDTLASVSPRGTVHECPVVHGASSNESFCLAVSSQLLVFDASCCTLHATLSFDGRVDAVAWSEGSYFLAIGERSGSFHFAHAATKQVLFSQELINDTTSTCEDDDSNPVFLSVMFTPRSSDGSYSLVILSASGMLFQFSNLVLEELHEAIENQDFGQVNKLRDAIQLDCVDLREIHEQQLSGVTVGSLQGEPVLISYGNGISIWGKDPSDNNNSLMVIDSVSSQVLGGSGIAKASTTNDGSFLVVLDEEHMLSLWAVDSLTMLAFWPQMTVEDFLLLNVSSVETPGSNKCDDDAYKIVILTTQGEKKRYLQVYSFPVMKQVYSLEVPRNAFLAECPCTQESIYFIEGIADGNYGRDRGINEIKALRVRCLTEALPENRLSRLLHKRQFDAAEKFARQFRLDIELVYKVKANWLLDMVSPWSYAGNEGPVRSQPSEQFSLEDLKDCLTKIKDDDYVAKCCLQAALLALEETYDLLSYARTRISSQRITAGDRGHQGLSLVLTEVLEALDRLATFEMAFGVASFSGSRWQAFLTADLMVEITKCLAQSEVTSAVIMWRRHQSTFDAKFTSEKLESLLGSVRQDMPSSEIIPWLRDDLVPFVAKVLPQPGLKILASWLEMRARDMELSEKNGWPGNALSLANVLLSASKSVSESAFGRGLATPQQFVNQVCGLPTTAKALLGCKNNDVSTTDELHNLMVLVQQLTELVQLHTKYGCQIPLAEFAQETTNTIVFRLLDRVIAAELIPAAIEKQIGPYMEHHGLNRDTIFLEYIKDVVKNSTRALSALSNSLLEARIIAVISCIKCKELRCKATLQVMRCAATPWSESVENLVAEAKHAFPSNQELEEQYRLVELKKMLCQYGMRSYQVSHSSRAKEMARFILTKDQPTAMDDALKVVNAYSHMSTSDAYTFRMQKFCVENKVCECVDLLESLPELKAQEYSEQLVVWLCQILEEKPYEELDSNNEHITAGKAAVTILKFMKRRDMVSYLDVNQLLHSLKNITALQTEFSVFLSVDEYEDADVQAELFDRYLVMYLAAGNGNTAKKNSFEMVPKDDNVQLSFSKLQRLCTLIGKSRNELKSELTLRAVERDDLSTALDLCRDLSEYVPTPEAADTLFKIAHCLCRQMAEGVSFDCANSAPAKNLTNHIVDLLSRATTHCHPDLLCDCLELAKCSSLANCVYSQCESGDYGFSVQNTTQSSKQDPFTEWTFSDRFREDGLVLDSYVALPLAFKFNVTCVPDCSDHVWQFYQARVAGRVDTGVGESKEVESGESIPQPSCLVLTSAAGLNIIRHLQENNLYELALRYVVETLGVCMQHYSTISLGESQRQSRAEKENANAPVGDAQQQMVKISQMALEMLDELTGSLLVKVLQCRKIDHDLGLGFLCSIPKKVAFKKLMSGTTFLGQSAVKVLSFTKIGIDFALLCKEPGLLDSCQKLAVNATWGQKLSKLKLSFKDIYKSDYDEHLTLLSEMVNHPRTDLDMILDFCRSYKLDEDEALLLYVKKQLLPNTVEAGFYTLPPYVADMTSQHREDYEYQGKVRAVADWISCKNSFVGLLVNVATKVDAYDYDKIMFILTLVKGLMQKDVAGTVEKGIELLKFLYHYERKAVPSSYERSFTCSAKKEDNADKICLDSELPLSPLSKSRLPYHPLLYGEPWKVIAPELDENTVPKLLGVAKLLKISSDQMYLTAIQNLFKSQPGLAPQPITEGFAAGNSSDAVEAYKVQSFKFERAQGMLYSIRNAGMAIATAKWVAKQLPVGKEKIAALKTCVDLAEKWKNSCSPEDAEKAALTSTLLADLCRVVQTEHVLHRFNITDPSLLALVSQPAKLICSLYKTYGDREPGTTSQFPDAHNCADEVASVNNKDISKIRCHLIEKWLISTQSESQAAVSGSVCQTGLGEEDVNDEAEKNLRRVIYFLQYNPVDQSVAFLLNIAYKTSSATITNTCRLRALRALFAVAPRDAIESVCKKPVTSIRQYMESLVCLTELEELHIQQSLSAFQKCNKEGLVRGVWRNHKHEKKAVRLVADLCLDNNIHDPQLWNSVLQQLLAFGMVKYLRRVLVCLAGVSALWQVPCLPHVWRSVLMAPFKSVSPPLSEEEQTSCHKSAALLQRCPLLLDLDVYSIAVQFHKVALPAHALACLVLIPPTSVRQQHIKKLLDTGCTMDVLNQLETQRKLGRTLTRADIVQQEIFRYIEENKQYQVLLGTPHFDALVRYLVYSNSIGGLILKTLEANRLANAVQLVQLYHQVHPNSVTAHAVAGQELDDFEQLWTFLEMNGLLEEAMPFLPQPEEPEEEKNNLEFTQMEHDEDRRASNIAIMKIDDSTVDFPI